MARPGEPSQAARGDRPTRLFRGVHPVAHLTLDGDELRLSSALFKGRRDPLSGRRVVSVFTEALATEAEVHRYLSVDKRLSTWGLAAAQASDVLACAGVEFRLERGEVDDHPAHGHLYIPNSQVRLVRDLFKLVIPPIADKPPWTPGRPTT